MAADGLTHGYENAYY